MTHLVIIPLLLTLPLNGQSSTSQKAKTNTATTVSNNPTIAELRAKAEQGNAMAQFKLGVMYFWGQGVPQDGSEAIAWIRKAADQGIAGAQTFLGLIYADGKLVAQDYVEAAKWFQKSADQGDPSAQYNLGIYYNNGSGVPVDDVKSFEWFKKAAMQGYQDAQRSVAWAYALGQGTSKNHFEAYVWANIWVANAKALTLEQRKAVVEFRESEGKLLTHAQRKLAQDTALKLNEDVQARTAKH